MTVRQIHRVDHGLTYSWSPSSVGPFIVGQTEIVRRIFVTVRDGQWREVAPLLARAEIVDDRHLRFEGRYDSPLIAFDWTGMLSLVPDQKRISFTIEGEVRRDGSICRLGLILLLPPSMAAGTQAEILTEKGWETAAIPLELGPQPIVGGWPAGLTAPFRAIELHRGDGARVTCSFAGELFEIEDQRNWGDASFKIYCTPLGRGFPRTTKAGERIAHGVEIEYDVAGAPETQATRLGCLTAFPAIGTSGAVQKLCGAFVSVLLRDAAAVEEDIPLEIRLSAADLTNPDSLVDRLRSIGPRIMRLLLSGEGERPPQSEAIAALKALMADAMLAAPLLLAVEGYFVELNRGVPLAEGADGVAWPLSPTVHADDLPTVLENVAPCGPMAAHVRKFSGGGDLAVVPLAWNYPVARPIDALPRDVMLWLAATLLDAAAAGIGSVTLDVELVDHLTADADTRVDLEMLFGLSGQLVCPVVTGIERLAATFVGSAPNSDLLVVNANDVHSELMLPMASEPIRVAARSLQLRRATEGRPT